MREGRRGEYLWWSAQGGAAGEGRAWKWLCIGLKIDFGRGGIEGVNGARGMENAFKKRRKTTSFTIFFKKQK